MKITIKQRFKKVTALMAIGLMTTLPSVQAQAQKQEVLKFYNWADYLGEETINKFEAETGIKVNLDVFDSNEVLESKLLAGHSGYDLVVPSSNFMGRLIKANVFRKLDKSKLPNMKHLDPKLMGLLENKDPGNNFGIPYLWGTTGIGYNVDLVQKALGSDAPLDSWDMVFKPENMEKLAKCGVMFLDSSDDIYTLALNYAGQNPNSSKPADYKKSSKAAKILKSVRPYISQFDSSQYVNGLASGSHCVAIGWSGDIFMAQARAEENQSGIELGYIIPKEGTSIWFDMLVIPADAENSENAHKFINFLMRPDIIAEVSNYVYYANPNLAATEFEEEDLSSNESIYPSTETRKRLFTADVKTNKKITRLENRFWTDFKSNR